MVSLHKFDDLLFNKNTKDLVDVESQVQHIQSPYLELVQVIYEVCHHHVQVARITVSTSAAVLSFSVNFS